MYALDDRPNRLCDGQTRREWLRVGGLSALGLGLGDLLRAGPGTNRAVAAPPNPTLVRGLEGATFGRARNVIFLWLQGGPRSTFPPSCAQEIRSARGGEYSFTVQASGSGRTREHFERDIRDALVCRLVLFRFADADKDPRRVHELASLSIRPEYGDAGQARSFTLRQYLGSTAGGTNFAIGHGLGVAVVVENATGAPIGRSDGVADRPAELRIHGVALAFSARPRHENTVD